jgi:hypothetical protein
MAESLKFRSNSKSLPKANESRPDRIKKQTRLARSLRGESHLPLGAGTQLEYFDWSNFNQVVRFLLHYNGFVRWWRHNYRSLFNYGGRSLNGPRFAGFGFHWTG